MKNETTTALELAKAAVLFVAIASATGCHQPSQIAAKPPTPVHLAEVTLYSSSVGLHYSASVLPFAQATLAFKSVGYVTEVKQVVGADGRRRDIGAGDYVTGGTVLARIRHQDLQNQLDAAAAAVTQAAAQHLDAAQNYERAKALYATQSLTKPDFDEAQARFDSTSGAVDQAKANLHQAQLAFEDADLKAPFSGYILARNVEVGDLTGPLKNALGTPGTEDFLMADTSAVKISFGVPDYAVRQLHLGQQFSIHVQDDPKEYSGRVTSIAASADQKNRVFAVELTIANPKSYLKPGMIASVVLQGVQGAQVPTAPLSAVVSDPASPARYAVFVATVDSGKWVAHLRQVTLGETHESDVAVDGLKPGEKVVAVGAAALKDGDFIEVLP